MAKVAGGVGGLSVYVLAKRWGGGLFIRSRARVGGPARGDSINLGVQAYSCQPVWGGEADGGKREELKGLQ